MPDTTQRSPVQAPLNLFLSALNLFNKHRDAQPAAPRYHYPKSALHTPNQLANGHLWLTAEMLLDDRSSDLLFDLLSELEEHGHDVEGAYFQYYAMRHVIETFLHNTTRIEQLVSSAKRTGMHAITPVRREDGE